MSDFKKIENKLEKFSRKYYTNELIKGTLLFISLGLLYFIFTLFIESFFWLKPTSRTILFWLFILVELFLLIRFIGFPLFKLFGLQKGISFEESSKIIGNHFPEVKDKLLNILQLKNTGNSSDLLLASIDQKANELQPIPFTNAINFKKNAKYLKYALIPLLIWLLTLVTGTNNKLTQSLDRVVNHKVAYLPPAPFVLTVTNPNLEVIQGKPLTIYVEAKGEIIPEQAKIVYNNQEYFLQNNGNGLFNYSFTTIDEKTDFHITSNSIQSIDYQINTIKIPTIQNVSLFLNYPGYLRRKNETIPNTGNVVIPQGTTITWNVKAVETDSISFISNNKRGEFKSKQENSFTYTKRIKNDMVYQIASSNKKLKDYESLEYAIEVIKDENPTIEVKSNIDSISRGNAFFAGQISDDYGFQRLQLVYYNQNNPQVIKTKNLDISKENVQSFFYEFPKDIILDDATNYELYFQVFDNDAVSGNKKTISRKFSYRQKSENELKEELLKEQEEQIDDLEKSLEKQQKSKKEIEKIQFDIQNKKNVNWNDQKKIKNLVERQQDYQQMMQKQTEKLQQNLSEKEEENENLKEKKEDLKKRIEELKKIEKEEKILDELMKMADKLNKEELVKKTKELAQQNKQKERSLERVLEMTKRFYVEQKTNQLADKLQELSKTQEELSKKNTSKEEQEKLKDEFNKAKKELQELQKENQKLKEPMDIPSMEELQKETEEELNKASDKLEQNNKQGAKENQKKASKKMEQMSQQMQNSMMQMSAEMKQENEEDIRQILENLLIFSFDQEDLMDDFSNINANHPSFGNNLKKQYHLKTYFEHIDDSLFVLSMRTPKLSSEIQNHLAEAHFNIDQSLENFAETRFRNGVSNQRYVMTSVNELSDILSNSLDNMQNSPPSGSSSGKGKKGESMSLPDIIQSQQEMIDKMKKGMGKKGEKGEPKSGEGKPGEEGEKEGKGGKGGKGEEGLNGELYEIYKEQAALRQQLENALKEGNNKNGAIKKALKQMEDLENAILEKGINQNTLNRMQRINQQLLKLDKALFKQGKEEKRKSTTNNIEYNNNAKAIEFKKQYYNQTEILNRQSLPLQQQYKKKVQEYFNTQKQD